MAAHRALIQKCIRIEAAVTTWQQKLTRPRIFYSTEWHSNRAKPLFLDNRQAFNREHHRQ